MLVGPDVLRERVFIMTREDARSTMDLYLSVADAARILGVTPQTVRLMIRRGTLPVVAKTVGGIHLFRREEVDQLAEQRAVQRHTSAAANAADAGTRVNPATEASHGCPT
jgi:excisionase family DNA binding protein